MKTIRFKERDFYYIKYKDILFINLIKKSYPDIPLPKEFKEKKYIVIKMINNKGNYYKVFNNHFHVLITKKEFKKSLI